ncbi:alpha/beta fold hydrolase [Brachybacterium sp. DNPG3]
MPITLSSPHTAVSEPEPAPLLGAGRLPVVGGHEIAFEVSGTEGGIPVLHLHGGPGGTLGAGYRRQVPADRAYLVGLHQRGAGRSTPSAGLPGPADLTRITTAHLVADIEVLREHLGVESWIVQGVSWGTTLALAYAQAHPERVGAMMLMALTTTSRREVDWITEGVGALFPEAWDRFAGFAERHAGFDRTEDSAERLRLVEAYRWMLEDDDDRLVDGAAAHWRAWEDEHIRIGTGERTIAELPERVGEQERRFARLVTHFWAADGFVEDWATPWGAAPGSGLLGGMHRIARIPAVLLHGRRDVSSPVRTAWELHRAWPASELVVVEDEGHGGPAMVAAWRAVMEHLVA